LSILIKTTEDQSFWIDVDGSKFLACPITSTRDSQIAKKHTKYKNGFPTPDQAKIRTDKFQETIQDWRNVKDVDDNDVPFSDELRDKFAKYNPDHAWRILRAAEQHDVDQQDEENKGLGKRSTGKKLK